MKNEHAGWPKHTSVYDAAAVTATPTTRNERPFRVTWSPAPTPSASAKAASITTPPSSTQLPWVSSGWSTETAAESRPTAHTSTRAPGASSSAVVAGYGPLWSTTPGTSASASSLARSTGGRRRRTAPTLATTSAPAVASRVRW